MGKDNLFIIHEGKKYARVSSAIRPFVDFSGIPEEVLNAKAVIGTRTHEAITDDIGGEMPILTDDIRGYFQSFSKWRATVSPIFVESERRYYNDDIMITGMIDAIIKIEGIEQGILVDWKTSVNESTISWRMQAHFYNYLLVGAGKQIASQFLFIKLDKYGAMPQVFRYAYDQKIMNKCLRAAKDFWSSDTYL